MNESKCILIVDDEEEGANLLAKRLRASGFRVACHYQGTGAVELARRNRPDLILLDVWMPDLSGPDVLRTLREDAELSGIPVIFLSADPSQESLCLQELGAKAFFRKPYDGKVLVESIREHLAAVRRPADAPAISP